MSKNREIEHIWPNERTWFVLTKSNKIARIDKKPAVFLDFKEACGYADLLGYKVGAACLLRLSIC